MKKILPTLLLSILAITGPFSNVQAKIDVSLNAATNYYFRGLSQTQNGPTANLGITYTHDSGFYVGNWDSNVSSNMYTNGYGLETDLFGGYKKELGFATIDVGVLGMIYPGAKTPDKKTKYDTYEVYGAVTAGPLKLQINQSLNKYFATPGTVGTRYYQSELAIPIDKRELVNINLHANYVDSPLGRDSSYYENKVGFTFSVLGGSLTAHYCQNNLKSNFKPSNTIKNQKLYKNIFIISYGYTKTF